MRHGGSGFGRFRPEDRERTVHEMVRSGRRLFHYIRRWWYQLAFVIALASVMQLLRLVQPWLVKLFIDDAIGKANYRLHAIIVGAAAVSLLGGGLLAFAYSYVSHMLGQHIVRAMRNELYTHLQGLSVRFFEDRPTGEIMSRVVNDSEAVEDMLVHSVETLITSVLTLVGVSIILFAMNVRLALFCLVPIPAIIVAVVYFSRRFKRLFGTFRQKVADLNAFVQERISGVRVVKSFSRERDECSRFEERTRDYYDSFMKAAMGFSIFGPLMTVLGGIGGLIVLYFGGRMALRGELSTGSFIAFLLYLGSFYSPVQDIGRQLGHALPRSLAAADRIFEFLDESDKLEIAPDAIVPDRLEGRVEIRDLSFGYKDETVLEDVNLTIEPGETVALVGPSGVGKTTLVDLICRFYDPKRGQVLVDGVDVRRYEPTALRAHIGMVLQEPFLFNTTVRENIAYGRPDCTDEDVYRAAEMAGADGFIRQFAEGYGTVVGERGVKLSVGQKQRISIARALLKDPAILILDEATSSVDTVTERVIQDALAVAAQGRTTILIAHRLSTTDIAGRIVVLEDGRMVEVGTQQELLALDGRFAELYRMQSVAGVANGLPAQ